MMSRRGVLHRAAGAVVGATALAGRAYAEASPRLDRIATNGRIKQSLVHWCFQKYWEPEPMAEIATQLGCVSVELIDPKHWQTLKKHGLACAIASVPISPGPPFMRGFNNPRYQPQAIEATRKTIDACAEFGCPSVISFTGFSQRDLDDPKSGHIAPEEGIKNCVAGYKEIIGYAEKKKVNICLEMLNTRDDSHPMKGHPGYQGDHTDYCMEIIRQVGSPRMKLLFDIYHVQIMDGDVIRRIRQLKDQIGHIHTAGNPGRGELDDRQEINYKPIMEALVEIGYTGYVGQEFIPTRDPMAGLKQAVAICDV
jgi:hydroxypyruvate isomerase